MFPAFAPHSAVLPDLQAAEDPEQVRAVGEVDDDVRRGLPQRDEHRQLLPLVDPYLVLGRPWTVVASVSPPPWPRRR